jgi:hypothetical protein
MQARFLSGRSGEAGIFTNMAKHGMPHEGPGNPWYWEDMTENPHYPAGETTSFELFSSIYLHEVAHGWFYLLTDYQALDKWLWEHELNPPTETQTNWRRDEEEICWEISRFVCKLLGIEFDEAAIPSCVRCGRILAGSGRPYCEDTGYKDTCRTSAEATEINQRNEGLQKL